MGGSTVRLIVFYPCPLIGTVSMKQKIKKVFLLVDLTGIPFQWAPLEMPALKLTVLSLGLMTPPQARRNPIFLFPFFLLR